MKKFRIEKQKILWAGLLIFLVILLAYGLGSLSKKEAADLSSSEIKLRCLNDKEQGAGYLKSKEMCYAKYFQKVAAAKGADFAFNLLFELQKLDPDTTGCHLIAHGIGWGTYEHNPDDWKDQIRSINRGCTYGAVHGIIENLVDDLPDKKMSDELVVSICGENPRADCNHIIGHLLVVETDGDVDKALKRCQLFADNKQKDFCYTGVFMEYQTALNLIKHGVVPEDWLNWRARVDDLEKMCRFFQGLEAEACWEEIVHAALVKFNNNADKIFSFCRSAPFSAAAERCRRHSIGIMAAANNFNLVSMKDICKLSQKDDPDFEGECYQQLVASSISSIPQDRRRVEEFCLGLPEKFKDSCLSQINYASKEFYPKD